mgnify:CR=1 FL=1
MVYEMKIFLTGAEGFIGSHLVDKLLKLKFKVKALVFYNTHNSYGWLEKYSKKNIENLEIVFGDIRDLSLLKQNIKGCDCIVNLAALISIPYSYSSPQSYIQTNTIGTLNLLEIARELKIKKFIHTSTSEVYGTPEYLPIDEKHRLFAQSPYAASKIAADQIVNSFYLSYNLPVIIARPFNTYGPRQSPRAIIPSLITQALENKKINVGNTKSTRDFNYVDDTVNAFISIINSNNKKIFGEVINFGTNFDISILELIDVISDLFEKKININIDKIRLRPEKSEVEKLRADNTKARSLLKWSPKYNNIYGLKKGLGKTIKWFSDEKNLNKFKSNIYHI